MKETSQNTSCEPVGLDVQELAEHGIAVYFECAVEGCELWGAHSHADPEKEDDLQHCFACDGPCRDEEEEDAHTLTLLNNGLPPEEKHGSLPEAVAYLKGYSDAIDFKEEPEVAPDHYTDRSIQPIDYIMLNKLGFCEGNVVKYVTRYKDAGGLEDLKKARTYLTFLIEQVETEQENW